MKFIVILIFTLQTAFAQTANGSSSNMAVNNTIGPVKIIHTENSVNIVKSDFNKDGKFDLLKGEVIIKSGSNEYWVKNTILTASSGNVVSFGNDLKVNNKSYMNQVNAVNGYIVVFEERTCALEVFIANEYGAKDSDVISINY